MFFYLSDFRVVRAVNHMKHITVDLLGHAKRLQIDQKNVDATVKAVEWVRVVAKKALEEANAYITIMEARMGIFFVENEVTN